MMTRSEFIKFYRVYVCMTYDWTNDAHRFEGFMAKVNETLTTDRTTWKWNDNGAKVAWKAIGGKGKLTLKALRAMPEFSN
jgi:hypothetical protein